MEHKKIILAFTLSVKIYYEIPCRDPRARELRE